MGIKLKKGGNISLTKQAPNLEKIRIGLGWDARGAAGAQFDLDASAFLLGANGKVLSEKDFIFYNQLKTEDGSVQHTGDNRTGAGEGDDETIKVNLKALSDTYQKIAVTVTIDEAAARKQNFGQVSNAYVRILDDSNGNEICRYDLSEDYSVETGMIFGELYRHNGEWKFRAVGQGYQNGLHGLCLQFGITPD